MPSYSIVEYISDSSGYKCGYCKNETTSFSQGMWAHTLNVEDYQRLIDRGWRRSGKYCYKPTMDKTCCPQYAIRCHAKSFKFSKSKKKVAKKMQHFLQSGGQNDIDKWKEHIIKKNSTDESCDVTMDEVVQDIGPTVQVMTVENDVTINQQGDLSDSTNASSPTADSNDDQRQNAVNVEISSPHDSSSSKNTALHNLTKKGSGPDPNKPLCKKAKLIRLERRLEKLNNKGQIPNETTFKSKTNERKALEEFLPHLTPSFEANHKLEVRLVRSNPRDENFRESKEESLRLYQKYQCAIHKDTLDDCTEKQWTRFLVDSPLNFESSGPGPGFGSFHNQYWIDDKLVAVGVVDILPRCVSSVYLYYDPDYGFLSLGVYSALSELALVKQFQEEVPTVEYYYMGFYIHSCPKMKYKGAFDPSEILCPETYKWVPVPLCTATLDVQSYARLNILNGGSSTIIDVDGEISNLNSVRCLFQRTIMDYGSYKLHKRTVSLQEDELVKEYASFVGRTCAQRMLLYRSDDEE